MMDTTRNGAQADLADALLLVVCEKGETSQREDDEKVKGSLQTSRVEAESEGWSKGSALQSQLIRSLVAYSPAK